MSIFKNWIGKVVEVAKGEAEESVREDVQKRLDYIGDVAKIAIFGVITVMAIKASNGPNIFKPEHAVTTAVSAIPAAQPVVQIFLGGEGATVR